MKRKWVPCRKPGCSQEMNIERYDFGRVDIDGTCYRSDVIVSRHQVQDAWRRREGHSLHIDDLDGVMACAPQVLVVGTGYYGRMQVPAETVDYLKSKGVRVIAAQTGEAVDEFNRLQKECANIVAALHLTC